MKLLSSDYDRTLNTFDYDLVINMLAIEKFRRNGNIFLLNTGRSYKSINREITKYHINYDYLSCCDGNLVLNKNNDILYSTNLSVSTLNCLNKLNDKYHCFKIIPITYNNRILEYEVKMYPVDSNIYLEFIKICQHQGLNVKEFERFELIGLKLFKVKYFYLCDPNISKSFSTSMVGELENISKCDIFTIGDHLNDLEMIRDFNGYTLPWAKGEIKNISNGVCLSVASLVKKISK